jgi:ABC-type multidrug transport system permease subunit
MMKILAYIFKDLRLYKKDFAINIVSFLIFPVLLSFFYGFMQERGFQSASKISKFSVSIEDKDNSASSKMISEVFKDKSLEDVLELKDIDEDLQIVIPQGFEKSLQSGERMTLVINQVKKDTAVQAHVVKGVLDSFTMNASIANGVSKNIFNSNLTEDEKKSLIASFAVKFGEAFRGSAIKEETLTMSKRLNSFEYYSIAMLTFISVLIIVSYSVEFIKERGEGTLKRVYSISINGRELFLGKVGFIFITSTLAHLAYVVFFRIIGKGFSGNIFLLLGAVVMNGLFIAAVSGLLISIFKDEKAAKVVLNTLMMVSVMLAGVFFPIDIIDNKFLNVASKFTPNSWLADMYKKLSLYNDVSAMLPSLGVLSAVIIISFVIGSYKMNKSWQN